MINKLKRSVIHLECAYDSADIIEESIRYQHGEITQNEFLEILNVGVRNLRSQGSAIFVKSDDKYFLCTAKHVVCKENSDKICNIIFRVKNFNETSENYADKILMNLGAGSSFMNQYTINPIVDLAVISLKRENMFIEGVLNAGYKPIDISDIYVDELREGMDIIAIGYPSYSKITKQNLDDSHLKWASNSISLPIISFGKVAMNHSNLDSFLSDISIFPGNSGGGIFFEDKLAGIVCSQPTIPIDNTNVRIRIPFAFSTKAKYLVDLIQEQMNKDSMW